LVAVFDVFLVVFNFSLEGSMKGSVGTGNAYEDFVKGYVERKMSVELFRPSECPQDILKALGLPGRDIGIDFIGRIGGDYYILVQAKFRTDTGATLPYDSNSGGGLKTFFSQVERMKGEGIRCLPLVVSNTRKVDTASASHPAFSACLFMHVTLDTAKTAAVLPPAVVGSVGAVVRNRRLWTYEEAVGEVRRFQFRTMREMKKSFRGLRDWIWRNGRWAQIHSEVYGTPPPCEQRFSRKLVLLILKGLGIRSLDAWEQQSLDTLLWARKQGLVRRIAFESGF
jgi:hypothetical protein